MKRFEKSAAASVLAVHKVLHLAEAADLDVHYETVGVTSDRRASVDDGGDLFELLGDSWDLVGEAGVLNAFLVRGEVRLVIMRELRIGGIDAVGEDRTVARLSHSDQLATAHATRRACCGWLLRRGGWLFGR